MYQESTIFKHNFKRKKSGKDWNKIRIFIHSNERIPNMGWWATSTGCQAWWPTFDPQDPHRVGKNWLPQVALWPTYEHRGMSVPPVYTHTHKLLKRIFYKKLYRGYYYAIKGYESLIEAATWMNLENTMLDEISQIWEDKYCMVQFLWDNLE